MNQKYDHPTGAVPMKAAHFFHCFYNAQMEQIIKRNLPLRTEIFVVQLGLSDVCCLWILKNHNW